MCNRHIEVWKTNGSSLFSYRDKTEKLYSDAQKDWLDLTEPLYPAAALFTACRSVHTHNQREGGTRGNRERNRVGGGGGGGDGHTGYSGSSKVLLVLPYHYAHVIPNAYGNCFPRIKKKGGGGD